jgi:hypothetical protein
MIRCPTPRKVEDDNPRKERDRLVMRVREQKCIKLLKVGRGSCGTARVVTTLPSFQQPLFLPHSKDHECAAS